jgi:3-oxosteroid 1-dehydrogenase
MTVMEQHVDVVVVGSGAGGMTAALTAGLDGCSVLLVEATPFYGGATAISGGAIWIPNNHIARAAGVSDSVADARQYMAELAGDSLPTANLDAFLEFGPRMVEELDRRTNWVRWRPQGTPDYLPERTGGRASGRTIAPAIIDGQALGSLRAALRPPSPAMDVRPFTITAEDLGALRMIARTNRGRLAALRVGARTVWGAVARHEPLGIGQALCARLRLALRDIGVPVWLSSPMVELTRSGQGDRVAVTGVRIHRNGCETLVRAHRGVVLATGGFSRNEEMRRKYLPTPTNVGWSMAPEEGQNGDGIVAGMDVGAATAMMNRTWGMPVLIAPVAGKKAPLLTQWERSLPGVMVVDRTGERYANETLRTKSSGKRCTRGKR